MERYISSCVLCDLSPIEIIHVNMPLNILLSCMTIKQNTETFFLCNFSKIIFFYFIINGHELFSMFHRAFFNSIIGKTPTYALFHSTLYQSRMLISLKYIKKYLKVLRRVSILTDHHQGVGMYLAKFTEYLKI